MIESIAGQLENSQSIVLMEKQSEPSPQEIAWFRREMAADVPADAEATPVVQIENGVPVLDLNPSPGIGARLVEKLNAMQADADAKRGELFKMIDTDINAELNTRSLLSMQVNLFQCTYHTEIVTKVADKSSEGVRTLFHQQG